MQIGKNKRDEDVYNPDSNVAELSKYSYKVSTVNANVDIGHAHIQNLEINMEGKSQLRISPDAAIDALTGSISQYALINMPYQYVKKLKPVAGN
ncbi:MAG: hypothetical protein QM640_12525 [Niabella sp.]